MRTFTAVGLLAVGLASTGLATEHQSYKGFVGVEDQACANKPEMKGDAECAKKYIKGGSPAVLVTEDGKVYKIANQAKIVASAGENVTVIGTLKGDTLTIDRVK